MKTIVFEGMQHSFPDDATDDEIRSVLEQMHPAPAPRVATLDERQKQRAALQAKRDAGAKQIQALEETRQYLDADQASELDAAIAALRAEQADQDEEISRTGVGSKGRNIGSTIGGIGGGIAGGMLGSPAGPAGAIGGGVALGAAGTGLGSYLGSKWDLAQADEVSEQEADKLVRDRVIEDVVIDTAGNVLLLGAGKMFKLLPGFSKGAAEALKAKVDGLAKLAPNPVRQQAVRRLAEKTEGGYVPTPGQVKGEAGFLETQARTAKPGAFEKAETAMQKAVEAERVAAMRPAGQGTRKELGEAIVGAAETAEKAVKDRTRPVFRAADMEGVEVDMSKTLSVIDDALAKNARSGGRLLSDGERADLENIRRALTPDEFAPPENASQLFVPKGVEWPPAPEVAPAIPKMSAGGAMDFVSGNKGKLRTVNPDGTAGDLYTSVITSANKAADDEFLASVGKASPEVRSALVAARNDYREMMGAVYDDATKKALKANPEDIGRIFWQKGNVSEIGQFQKLLEIAQREGKMSPAQAQALQTRLTRGFLDEVANDPTKLANWSTTLEKNTPLRETWEAMTSAPGGQELRSTMKLLEQMAQMAETRNMTTGGQFIPISRATHGGLGVSFVTGAVRPGWVLTGIGLTGATRALATMYTQGNKGLVNHMAAAMRAAATGTPAAIQGAKASFNAISKWAAQNGVEDPFTYEEVPNGR